MINARDIKDIELRDTLYVIKKFHYFFEELNHKENNQFENEERETILIVKFIKSGFLEKQLKAMDEIKNLILMSDPSSDYK